MNTKTTLSISEARKKIFEIAEKVQKPSTHYILTEKGRPKVAFMSAEEFESWQETLEVIRDFPNLEKDIKKSEREYERGSYSTLEKVLSKEGFVLADKPKK
jgi:antitoxin YefM